LEMIGIISNQAISIAVNSIPFGDVVAQFGDVVAQLAKARLGEPDCNAAVPGSIPAFSTVS
jgi:hypothetical protein